MVYPGKIINIHYINGKASFEITSPKTMEGTYLLHDHPNPHIGLVLQGGNMERIGNTVYERLPGDLVFYTSRELHQTIKKYFPSICINLEFDRDFLPTYKLSEDTVCQRISQKVDAKFLILKMYRELLTNDTLTNASIQLLLLGLVNESIQLSNPQKPKWIVTLYEILNDRWNEQITLADLSDLLDVHPVTISRYFPMYFSCTLGEYIRKLKINRSISLIRNTPLSLTAIALECGFTDQSHFIRTFKSMTGFLPGKFRKLSH